MSEGHEFRPGLEFDVAALERHFAAHLPQHTGPLRVRQFPGGQSNPTYLIGSSAGSVVLRRMGRADLIGPGKQHLVPPWQPAGTGTLAEGARARGDVRKHGGASAAPGGRPARPFRTQHTGLPDAPRKGGGSRGGR